jgi:multidrug efflux pump subunit AcrB
VLIDQANRNVNSGMQSKDAVLSVGIQRFRPILLTTITTFGGLMPMITETSFQARMMIPMAISLGFGVVFATLITLVMVPASYLIVEDVARWVGRWHGPAVLPVPGGPPAPLAGPSPN